MELGDSLTCKKDYYDSNSKIYEFFNKPLLKKGKKYRIDDIMTYYYHSTGSTYNNSSFDIFELNFYKINNKYCGVPTIEEYFLNIKEERNIKLNKIEKLK